MRVYLSAPRYGEVIISERAAAARFLRWISRDDNGEMTDLLWAFCLTPPEMGGLGALPESMDTVTALHGAVTDAVTALLTDREHRN